jgi:hypothetical protein
MAALAGGLLSAPLVAWAQQAGKVWRIGYLSPAEAHNPIDEAFERSMKDLGYIEGQNVDRPRRRIGEKRHGFFLAVPPPG